MSDQAERTQATLDLVEWLSESAVGMRNALIAGGFSDHVAEGLAANFYMMMLANMTKEIE